MSKKHTLFKNEKVESQSSCSCQDNNECVCGEKCTCLKNEDEIKALKIQAEEVKQKWLRAVADYQNLEKRLEKEKLEWIKFANVDLLLRILEVSDNLNRAAQFIKDPGLDMVRSNLEKILKDFGVEEIPALGKTYEPTTMECLETKPCEESKKDIVLDVVLKGYSYQGRILRPAKVIVGENKN